MPKDIAVVSYNLNLSSSRTADAIVIRDTLNNNGYSAQIVHQYCFNEVDRSNFKLEGE